MRRELGQALLQVQTNRIISSSLHIAAPHSSEAAVDLVQTTECELPEGARWCTVRLANLPPFSIAVYGSNTDIVSRGICENGMWEVDDISDFGAPGHLLDIGGNIGYYALAFAQAGWNVTTFEPMAPNLALVHASLCQNPLLAAQIHVNPFGLGSKSENCSMISAPGNFGDGLTTCAGDVPFNESHSNQFQEVGRFFIRRLDEVLLEQNITQVDLVKIDVEGYESRVFSGAPAFIEQYHPRLIKSEVWVNMTGPTTGVEYLANFERAGYQFFKDSTCIIPMDAKNELLSRGTIDVVMCKGNVSH